MQKLLLALFITATAGTCCAQPRWCTITSLGPGQNLLYPPIAKAARVQGHVMERVIYLPGGGALSFEFISGPRMLAASLEDQMKEWIIRTSASGDAPCTTLVIADFTLDDTSGEARNTPIDVSIRSILQLKVSTTPICLCDPEAVITHKPFYRRFGHEFIKAWNELTRRRAR